ncbi:MAG: family 16 glycosylhydrolase, partial [Pseudomonadota bacterium]
MPTAILITVAPKLTVNFSPIVSDSAVITMVGSAYVTGDLGMQIHPLRLSNLVLIMVLAGCVAAPTEIAVNIGGGAYRGVDGTEWASEKNVAGGMIDRMGLVKGSQDAPLYYEYREGTVEVSQPLANGYYDVTFHFAEPDDVGGGERVFDALVEGQVVIKDLDVMASRDGKTVSALTVTVPDVEVADGELTVTFAASAGASVLSALLARPAVTTDAGWTLAWADEFDGETLNDALWSPNLWPARKVNDEDQAYTDRHKNLRLEDGKLVIEAHLEDYDNAKYTSARIHSAGKGDILYGRIEVSAKLPRGKGSWPAIWMLPSDPFRYATQCSAGEDWQGSATCDAWPNSGEIDIMEHVGYQMGHVHGTVHNKAYYWLTWEQRKGRILLEDVDEAFHVYALEWSPER